MQELFKKYLTNQCSPEEVKLLLKHFNLEENKELLSKLIIEQLDDEEGLTAVNENEQENILAETYQNIRARINTVKKIESPFVPLSRRVWFRIAAAAVVVLAVAGVYLLIKRSPNEQPLSTNETSGNDIGPGGNKASLTLADGSVINLETTQNGKIAQQGNTQISKLNDGQIVYTSSDKPSGETLINTITTPRGGQYQLTLADGSKVWLNSASSIRYPDSFMGKERRVEITGEVYFEVAKNASMPFKVNVGGKKEVEALGTHFNINSYPDETTINTTLLEGSIKVIPFATQQSQIIAPGQQVQLTKNGHVIIDKKADIDKVMAWKNGYFNFDGADTKTVMRFISRWYDVDIAYEGSVPERKFGGEIGKDLKLYQVLKILEKNNLHFMLQGRQLTVTSQ